jgi:TrpR-related protein YerC/YecD
LKQRMRDKAVMKRLENKLFQALLALETVEEYRRFFADLCTPAEMEAMADRWNTVEKLMKKESYREIAAETDISLTTIGRVARCLYGNGGGYRLVLEKQGEWKND